MNDYSRAKWNGFNLSAAHTSGSETPPPRLLDQVRNVIRCKHYSTRTEKTYIDWIKRFIRFHDRRHPKDLDEKHIAAFLTYLAVRRNVASSTQNQALCALVFLYKEVIKKSRRYAL